MLVNMQNYMSYKVIHGMCYPVALPLTYLHFAVLVVIDITIEKTAARVSQHMSHKRCMHPSRQWIFGHMHGAVFTIVRIHRHFKSEDFKLKMTPSCKTFMQDCMQIQNIPCYILSMVIQNFSFFKTACRFKIFHSWYIPW